MPLSQVVERRNSRHYNPESNIVLFWLTCTPICWKQARIASGQEGLWQSAMARVHKSKSIIKLFDQLEDIPISDFWQRNESGSYLNRAIYSRMFRQGILRQEEQLGRLTILLGWIIIRTLLCRPTPASFAAYSIAPLINNFAIPFPRCSGLL